MKSSVAIDLLRQMIPGLASTLVLIRTVAMIVASLMAMDNVTVSAFSQTPSPDNG